MLLKYNTDIITLLNKKDKTATEIAQEKTHKDVLLTLKEEFDRDGKLICSIKLVKKICYFCWIFIYIISSILQEHIFVKTGCKLQQYILKSFVKNWSSTTAIVSCTCYQLFSGEGPIVSVHIKILP